MSTNWTEFARSKAVIVLVCIVVVIFIIIVTVGLTTNKHINLGFIEFNGKDTVVQTKFVSLSTETKSARGSEPTKLTDQKPDAEVHEKQKSNQKIDQKNKYGNNKATQGNGNADITIEGDNKGFAGVNNGVVQLGEDKPELDQQRKNELVAWIKAEQKKSNISHDTLVIHSHMNDPFPKFKEDVFEFLKSQGYACEGNESYGNSAPTNQIGITSTKAGTGRVHIYLWM